LEQDLDTLSSKAEIAIEKLPYLCKNNLDPHFMFKNRLFIAALGALLLNLPLQAQKEAIDPKAKAILDELSQKTKSFKTIKSTFTLTTETKDKKKDSQEGSIFIKGKQYKMNLKGQEFYNNGTFTWNYVESAKETTKDFAPKPEEKGKGKKGIDVSKMFTIYEEGYKYRFEKEEPADGTTLQVIDLYPLNPDAQDFHTIKLMIDKNKKQIHSVKFLNKDGSTRSISLKSFVTDSDMPDALFNYEATQHPGIHLEDMTKD
jgi:outer membrane lipoprotein carrier protein